MAQAAAQRAQTETLLRGQFAQALEAFHHDDARALQHLFPEQRLVAVLRPGAHFGDVELIGACVRSGTVVCLEDAQVLALGAECFRRLLQAQFERRLERKIAYLRGFPFLTGLPRHVLVRLHQGAQKLVLQRGQTVFEEGDDIDAVYILRRGSVQLSRRCAMLGRGRAVPLLSRVEKLNQSAVRKLENQRLVRLPIYVKQENQLFGDLENVESDAKRVSRAEVVSLTAKILQLPLRLLLWSMRHYETIQIFRDLSTHDGEVREDLEAVQAKLLTSPISSLLRPLPPTKDPAARLPLKARRLDPDAARALDSVPDLFRKHKSVHQLSTTTKLKLNSYHERSYLEKEKVLQRLNEDIAKDNTSQLHDVDYGLLALNASLLKSPPPRAPRLDPQQTYANIQPQ